MKTAGVSSARTKKPKKRRAPITWRTVFWTVRGSDPWITGVMFVMILFGFIMVVSSKQGTTIGQMGSFLWEITKQLVFVIAAWEFGMVWLSRNYPYKMLTNGAWQNILIIGYTAVLALVAVVGVDAGGSRAWLAIGPLTIQPSEFGKPLLIVLIAAAARDAGKKHAHPESFFHMFWRPILLLVISIVFVGGLQKDFGSLIITLGIGLVGFMITSDVDIRHMQRWILIGVLIVLIVLIFGVYFSDIFVNLFRDTPLLRHIATRIENMKNPYASIHSAGYQPANALYSLADSGLFGRGLGSSVRKYGFLTQAESDYILAIVIEETGIIGLTLIAVGYGILLWRLIHWSLRARKPYDKVLLCCAASYFMLHFFVNVGGVSTLIPMTGVPLLLISAGGSALIAACIVAGMAQNRIYTIREEEEEREAREHHKESLTELIEEDDSALDYSHQ